MVLLTCLTLLQALIAHAIYYAASECIWFTKENPTAYYKEMQACFLEVLTLLEKRWLVAGKFSGTLFSQQSLINEQGII